MAPIANNFSYLIDSEASMYHFTIGLDDSLKFNEFSGQCSTSLKAYGQAGHQIVWEIVGHSVPKAGGPLVSSFKS